jgi:uncharacterized protein YcaQ
MHELSLPQAQKLIVLQQKLHISSSTSKGVNGTQASITQLGYVQIDSISVIARAHHHSLYNRVKNYQEQHLETLLNSGKIFEYWAHAAAYLPIEDYRYSLVRKLAIKRGEVHWFKQDKKLMKQVLATISDNGPMMAKDFNQEKSNKHNAGWWDWKPAKIALEQLFMQGDLMVTQRRGFQKEYDLTDRVLPRGVNTTEPSRAEYCEYLILNYLKCNALAKTEHFGYLLKGIKQDIKRQLHVMLAKGQLQVLQIAGQSYYTLPGFSDLLSQKLSQHKVKILSPFDNILIQRKRIKELFEFDYQIECYVPAPKRVYGYFSLPLLQGQSFVGRMDVKLYRKSKQMHILHLHLHTSELDKLLKPLVQSLKEFMRFNQAEALVVEKISADCNRLNSSSISAFKQQLSKAV